jgi:hypothetical protein
MAPELLLAAYHPASGTERAYSGVGLGKNSEKGSRCCGRSTLRWRKASLRLPPAKSVFLIEQKIIDVSLFSG